MIDNVHRAMIYHKKNRKDRSLSTQNNESKVAKTKIINIDFIQAKHDLMSEGLGTPDSLKAIEKHPRQAGHIVKAFQYLKEVEIYTHKNRVAILTLVTSLRSKSIESANFIMLHLKKSGTLNQKNFDLLIQNANCIVIMASIFARYSCINIPEKICLCILEMSRLCIRIGTITLSHISRAENRINSITSSLEPNHVW